METILIVEDDFIIRTELKKLLESNNYKVELFTLFLEDIKKVIYESTPSLVLLDINLPNKDGFAICKEIRKVSKVPIIFVTSSEKEEDELKSILLGGDDFVTKPYNKTILLEKIKRALEKNNPVNYKELCYNNVVLDLHLSLIRYDDKEIELTRNEFLILYYFFLNPKKIITKEELLEYLWNDKYYLNENVLTVNIKRLRVKLEEIGITNFIKTIHGKGYSI